MTWWSEKDEKLPEMIADVKRSMAYQMPRDRSTVVQWRKGHRRTPMERSEGAPSGTRDSHPQNVGNQDGLGNISTLVSMLQTFCLSSRGGAVQLSTFCLSAVRPRPYLIATQCRPSNSRMTEYEGGAAGITIRSTRHGPPMPTTLGLPNPCEHQLETSGGAAHQHIWF